MFQIPEYIDEAEFFKRFPRFVGVFDRKPLFNCLPTGWRALTEKEFAQSPFHHQPVCALGNAQFCYDEQGEARNKPALCCDLFFFADGTGYAIEPDYWGGKVNYYAFGCDHKFKELSQKECREQGLTHHGNFWHVYRCELCGHTTGVDSSG